MYIQRNMKNAIVVVGATGNLGGRIVDALLKKGAEVRAVVRPSSDRAKIDELKEKGVTVIESEMTDVHELAPAFADAAIVVSSVAGLRDVIVDAQSILLDAAIAAGVPRFIPSDFSSDFTQQAPGLNRNFDLRREFQERLDKAPIQATSILNGAFGEILTYNIPLLDVKRQQVGYWDDADWRVDFTTIDDTAAAALDPTTPRFLRIASFQISPKELVTAAAEAGKGHFALVQLGSRADLATHIQHARAANPAGEQELYANWQQMQYMLSMFSIQNEPLDNARYPNLTWTPARNVLAPRPK